MWKKISRNDNYSINEEGLVKKRSYGKDKDTNVE